MKDLLAHELSPVTLSIATTAGELRSADKAVLGKIFGQGVTCATLPPSNLLTCTIIDGQALVQSIGKTPRCSTFEKLAGLLTFRVMANLNETSPRADVVLINMNSNQ